MAARGQRSDQAKYECRHGLSYSKFSCDYNGIKAEQTLFIPMEDDVELWDVRIRNTGDKPRKLSVFSYVEFSFHHIEIDNQNLQMSLYAAGSSYADGIIEYDFFYEPWTFHYLAASFEPDSYDCVRDRFLGNYRTETNPLAVERGRVPEHGGTGRKPLRRAAQAADHRARRRGARRLHAGRRPARDGKARSSASTPTLPRSTRRSPRCATTGRRSWPSSSARRRTRASTP